MNRVVHFEIHAADPERAAAFYADLFGWEIREWRVPDAPVAEENRYWLVTTGSEGEPGIDGGILVRRGDEPSEGQAVNAYVCTIGVESIDECIGRATGAGATIVVPKMPVGGVGWLVYCKDTEGNIFGMMQADKDAS